MDAVTYPDEDVTNFIQEHLIPLRIRSNQKPLADDFKVTWTPCLIALDNEGKEHHRSVGFLPPEEMIPMLLLGMGKTRFDLEDYDRAMTYFDRVIDAYTQSGSTPEAIFFRGVAQYKKSGDPGPLKGVYDTLNDKYPDSEWAKRAQPYRLIG